MQKAGHPVRSSWLRNRLSKSAEVSNKVSATLGATVKAISVTVGFDVTKSTRTTISYSAELKKRAHYTLRAGAVYKVYAFNVHEKRGSPVAQPRWNLSLRAGWHASKVHRHRHGQTVLDPRLPAHQRPASITAPR